MTDKNPKQVEWSDKDKEAVYTASKYIVEVCAILVALATGLFLGYNWFAPVINLPLVAWHQVFGLLIFLTLVRVQIERLIKGS